MKTKENELKVFGISFIALIILTFYAATTQAQSRVSFSVQQDVKFATIGDKKRGYDAFTTDVLIRFKMQGNVKGWGYMVVFPEFEFADIDGKYYRYSANVGYTLNNLILDKFEATPYIGYGYIDRYGKCFSSFGSGVEIGYILNDKIKILATGQATQRNDLAWMWGTRKIGLSGFIGIEFGLYSNR